jgi:hypothetical protein
MPDLGAGSHGEYEEERHEKGAQNTQDDATNTGDRR